MTDDGLRRQDIKRCAGCGAGVGPGFTFFEVHMRPHAVDASSVDRAAGLEQAMGGGSHGAMITDTLGPNELLTRALGYWRKMLVCSQCAAAGNHLPCVGELYEKANDERLCTTPQQLTALRFL